MDLRHYFDILQRRFWAIVIVVSVTLGMMAGYSLLATPVYKAQTTVRILLDVGISDFVLRQDYTIRMLNTYVYVLESLAFREKALERLEPRYGERARQGLRDLKSEAIPDSELIRIIVYHEDPQIAQEMANLLVILLREYAQNLYVGGQRSVREVIEDQLNQMRAEINSMRQRLAQLTSTGASEAEIEMLYNQIKFEEDSYDRLLDRYELARLNESIRANSISVVQPAAFPRQPSNAPHLRDIGLTLVVGLLGGIGVALVLENLDTRIRSVHQLEHILQITVIGTVPKGSLHLRRNGKRQTKQERMLWEAYHLLALNLQAQIQAKGIKTLLITSAMPREGKSMVASNLSQVMAEQARMVFIIESDMRRPTLKEHLGLAEQHIGLSELLTEAIPLEIATCATDHPSLFAILSGSPPANPTALLATPGMHNLLAFLRKQTYLTILDAPPVLGIADVSVLASQVDAILLVVRQDVSRREQVQEALKQLKAVQGPILGAVFLRKGKGGWEY